MNEKITGLLIDVENETASVKTIDNTLDAFYDALNCNLVEMPTRKIGVRNGRYYTIICDEEGLFTEQPKISAIDNMGQPMLVGNLFLVKNDSDDGELKGLDEADIMYLKRFVMLQGTRNYPKPYPMLHQCEYC